MKRYDWCSFAWDDEAFPDPAKYLADIKKEYNLKICAWINPYIAQRAEIFKEGRDKGYFVKRLNGNVWQWCVYLPIYRVCWKLGLSSRDYGTDTRVRL